MAATNEWNASGITYYRHFVRSERSQVLYAADSFSGVYRSTYSGRVWQQINTAFRMRAVNRLAVSTDGLHLYAATEGGGVYRLDFNGEPPQPALN